MSLLPIYSPTTYIISSLKLSTTEPKKKFTNERETLYSVAFPLPWKLHMRINSIQSTLYTVIFYSNVSRKNIVRKLIWKKKKQNLNNLRFLFHLIKNKYVFLQSIQYDAEMVLFIDYFLLMAWYCLCRLPTFSLLCIRIDERK